MVQQSSEQYSDPCPARLVRILDAAANRAAEALRVLEDYARFALDDAHLTGRLKEFRHHLAQTLSEIPLEHRLAARETQTDVGTRLTTASEEVRASWADLRTANFMRLQEALRSLEEYSKPAWPSAAAAAKQLRYQSYTLHKAVETTCSANRRLGDARLYVLIDGQASAADFERLVASLVAAGVHLLQLRDKRLDDRTLLGRAKKLRELTRGSSTLFIVNDRPDVAALSDADGVHVGQEELAVSDARTIVGAGALVGVSTHSIEQARKAVLDGADYIGVGPTFPSETKHFERFTGFGLLGQVAAEIRLPAFAIGGITAENLGDVLAAGFSRVAVGAAVTAASDPAAAAKRLLTMLAARGAGCRGS